MARKQVLAQADRKLLKAFGNRVKQIREGKKRTVYDVTGDDMPVKTRQHWQMIENGKKNIQLTTIARIADSLEIEPAELFK